MRSQCGVSGSGNCFRLKSEQEHVAVRLYRKQNNGSCESVCGRSYTVEVI